MDGKCIGCTCPEKAGLVYAKCCPQGGDTKGQWENQTLRNPYNHGQADTAVHHAGIRAYM